MMKRIALLLALILMFTAAALAESEIAEDWMVQDDSEDAWSADADLSGAWALTDPSSAKLDKSLKATFEKAVADMTDVKYTPVGLLGSQVVAGTNYCILCRCEYTTGGAGWCLVYLYENLGGEAEVSNVVNLDIADLSDYGLLN